MRVEAEKGMNSVLSELLLTQSEALLGQHDDRASLGRLVGERGELRGLGEVELVDAADRQELRRLPVAERDGSRLVEQQHVDVTRGLDRAADIARTFRCTSRPSPQCRLLTAALRSSWG